MTRVFDTQVSRRINPKEPILGLMQTFIGDVIYMTVTFTCFNYVVLKNTFS